MITYMGATEITRNGIIQKTILIIQRPESYSGPRQAYASGYKQSRGNETIQSKTSSNNLSKELLSDLQKGERNFIRI